MFSPAAVAPSGVDGCTTVSHTTVQYLHSCLRAGASVSGVTYSKAGVPALLAIAAGNFPRSQALRGDHAPDQTSFYGKVAGRLGTMLASRWTFLHVPCNARHSLPFLGYFNPIVYSQYITREAHNHNFSSHFVRYNLER